METDSPADELSWETAPVLRIDRAVLLRRKQIDRGLRWLRSCAVCASFLPPIDLLCPRCWQVFERVRNRGPWLFQPGYPIPVYSLLTWTDENDVFVRPFIYGLKRGWAAIAYEKLMHYFLFEKAHSRALPKPLFVSPPSSGRRVDHALMLSSLFAEALVAPLLVLAYPKVKGADIPRVSQKDRSRSERSERRFEFAEVAAMAYAGGASRVFVDDVITTGSTALAAAAALGNPEHFEAWTLVCRPKLAAHRRI